MDGLMCWIGYDYNTAYSREYAYFHDLSKLYALLTGESEHSWY